MTRNTILRMLTPAVFACTIMFGSFAWASVGSVLKYSQLPGYLVDPLDMDISGENIASDVDWNVLSAATQNGDSGVQVPQPPNWIIADDFSDLFETGVVTVRWWGSYVGPTFRPNPFGGAPIPIFGPGSEDGYVLSFFSDKPVDATQPFSRPDQLLATYVAPFDVVTVTSTGQVGWDGHEIWQYEVIIDDTHLEHVSIPGIADDWAFRQKPKTVYWLAINAEVGHTIVKVDNPDGTTSWVEQDTGKFALPNPDDPLNPDGHFWGWHTSPQATLVGDLNGDGFVGVDDLNIVLVNWNQNVPPGNPLADPSGDGFVGVDDLNIVLVNWNAANDAATMGHLVMGPAGEWIYPTQDWQPVKPDHFLNNMAFQLLTIPEPASLALIGTGLLMLSGRRRVGTPGASHHRDRTRGRCPCASDARTHVLNDQ